MEYLIGILVICLGVLLAQRYLPLKWQTTIQWGGVTLLLGMLFHLTINPYRVARIWHDLTHLLG